MYNINKNYKTLFLTKNSKFDYKQKVNLILSAQLYWVRVFEIPISSYKDAIKVVSVTESFKEKLISRGIDEKKIEIVTNGSNLELFYPREKDKELLEKLNLKDKFVIGYIGTHGMAHSLNFIVKSIAKIRNETIHFLFIGDGATKAEIIKMAKELNLKNITFLSSIKKEEVPRYLSICDISLAPLKKSDTFKTVIPSKIFEASAMQKPTLLGVEGESKKIIEKYNAGICFEPENEQDFIEKLKILNQDKIQYKKMQIGCQKLSLNFDRKYLAKKMLDIIKMI